ncbi:hypothetical protein LEP1GSC195_1613 [Leptospira wolbachii serovar Codice str. CDC]|uniref:Uncharacterized protein n=1 Tax=Leptospira wolbachii serovar Codice str. CDC TaxID=1218599 RepID=R9A4I3_9LEPT|nr:hypothetical protein LEP1GSC195_1613 [Leptospira wolbachii serovar Codice str. CDC]
MTPFPKEEETPPVIKIYLVLDKMDLKKECFLQTGGIWVQNQYV